MSLAVYAFLSYRSLASFASSQSSSWIFSITRSFFDKNFTSSESLYVLSFTLFLPTLPRFHSISSILSTSFASFASVSQYHIFAISFSIHACASCSIVLLVTSAESYFFVSLTSHGASSFSTLAGHGTFTGDPCFALPSYLYWKLPSHSTL